MAEPVADPLDRRLTGALGERTAKAIQRAFGHRTVGDLLQHYPRRYARRGELTALSELAIGDDVTIVAEVRSVTDRPMRQRRGSILEVQISDGHGILTLTFFNQAWRRNDLRPGVRGVFAGKVGDYRGARQLAHPDYELFADDDARADPTSAEARAWAETPIPIYPASGSMPSWKLQQAIGVLLDALGPLEDPVPEPVRTARGLIPFRDALEKVHRPTSDRDWRAAHEALRFQEAFLLQTALLAQRAERAAEGATPREAGALLEGFDAALPFPLTGDQTRVGAEIADDLARPEPMNRLVQGEVGSGKTLVAVRAMLTVAQSGGQTAFLAPTEVLAAQHLRAIAAALGKDLAARLRPTLVTGSMPAADRKRALLAAASGSASIVVGTHALLGERVQFAELGLVVVDEQHRFGVEQREALRLKGAAPHLLVLTATPIPRTVAMTVFGDLDVSTIAELPAGRIPIQSVLVDLAAHPGWEARIWERMAEELAEGRQAFVVCPAIDASAKAGDDDDPAVEPSAVEPSAVEPVETPAVESSAVEPVETAAANVTDTLARLRAHPALAEYRVEALHGRMTSEQKDATMRAFAAGDIDVLVATTVIEVGVDVPNASTMVVLDADRFGVAQLHQLRGRVGRGGVPGLCLFVTHAEPGELAHDRVAAVAATLDGFALAEADLELRREGDVLGRAQSGGRSSLKLLRVVRDGELIAEARQAAGELLEADPRLAGHAALRRAILRRLDDDERAFLGSG